MTSSPSRSRACQYIYACVCVCVHTHTHTHTHIIDEGVVVVGFKVCVWLAVSVLTC
jgi:hypothetical protein